MLRVFDTTLQKANPASFCFLILIIVQLCGQVLQENDLVKLQLAQNRVEHLALHCNQRADINTMHASVSWLRVEERLTASHSFYEEH